MAVLVPPEKGAVTAYVRNHRKPWAPQDVKILRRIFRYTPTVVVSHRLGRTVAAVRSKFARDRASADHAEKSTRGTPPLWG